MTRKDYEAAARIVQTIEVLEGNERYVAQEAFARLFACDNPRFDVTRFRAACVPGANVQARGRKEQVA